MFDSKGEGLLCDRFRAQHCVSSLHRQAASTADTSTSGSELAHLSRISPFCPQDILPELQRTSAYTSFGHHLPVSIRREIGDIYVIIAAIIVSIVELAKTRRRDRYLPFVALLPSVRPCDVYLSRKIGFAQFFHRKLALIFVVRISELDSFLYFSMCQVSTKAYKSQSFPITHRSRRQYIVYREIHSTRKHTPSCCIGHRWYM